MKIGRRHTHKVGEKSRTPGDNTIFPAYPTFSPPSIYTKNVDVRNIRITRSSPSLSPASLEYFLRSKSSVQRRGSNSPKEAQKRERKTRKYPFPLIRRERERERYIGGEILNLVQLQFWRGRNFCKHHNSVSCNDRQIAFPSYRICTSLNHHRLLLSGSTERNLICIIDTKSCHGADEAPHVLEYNRRRRKPPALSESLIPRNPAGIRIKAEAAGTAAASRTKKDTRRKCRPRKDDILLWRECGVSLAAIQEEATTAPAERATW